MEIKLEKLRNPDDTLAIESMINSRLGETLTFRVSLEKIEAINLACFNALIRLYIKYTREGKDIKYVHCYSDKMKHFVDKTQFYHVFDTQ